MTNLPNNTPSEQPANAQASPSPSRQSLESEMNKALDVFIKKWCGDNAAHLLDNDENDGERLRHALLKTVDRYVEERERLARIDELARINMMIADNYFENEMNFGKLAADYFEERNTVLTEALRQQVKGAE